MSISRVPTVGVAAADEDGVGVGYQAQMRQALVLVGSGDGEPADRIVRGIEGGESGLGSSVMAGLSHSK